jgi:hypothetical protein
MAEFDPDLPIPYVPIADKATEVRAAIDAARLSAANSFGGLQKLAIPGPFATDAEANTFGVPDDNLYYRSDGTVRAASHISLDLAFALDKTLTARTGPTPTFSRASSGLFVNANGILVGKTEGTTLSLDPTSTTVGTTEVTVAVASGSVVGWLVGQSVSLIVDSNANNAPDTGELWLVGDIVSTTATQLVFKVTSKGTASASATVWTLGYRGARFDHDPATGDSKGLLIEELRENLLARSNQFNTSPWAAATVTVAEVAGGGLDGGSAWRLTPTGADSSLGQTRTVAVTAAHTLSVWLKSDTGSNVNLSLSVYDNTAGVGRGTKPVTVTTQWQRFEMTTSTVVAGNSTAFIIGAFGSWSTGENVLAFGAQLEAGAFPTSYIPTTSGTAARSSDVCSITGTDFSGFYNQSEGSVLVATSIQNFGGNNRGIWGINNNTASHGFLTYTDGALSSVLSQSRSVSATTLLGSFSPTAGVTFKRILAYYPSGCSISTNGSTIATTAVTNSTQTMLTIQVGNMLGGSFQGSCHIASLRYYRKRLSNAKLQALTTP